MLRTDFVPQWVVKAGKTSASAVWILQRLVKAGRCLVSADFIPQWLVKASRQLANDVCILHWLIMAGKGMAIGIRITPRLLNDLASTVCISQSAVRSKGW